MALPRLVYDGDCGFCTWAARLVARHGDVTLVAFAELSPDQRVRLPDGFERCSHLLTDDEVYSCGEGATRAIAETDLVPSWLFPALERLPGFARARERCYRFVADHRAAFGRLASASPPGR